jgi:hypothetical protein
MQQTTAQNVRRILASNFSTLTSYACHYRNFPRQISVTALASKELACLSQANFAFQIYAITAEDYCRIRDLTNDVTTALKRLRKVYNADNYLSGQCMAITRAKGDVGGAINLLIHCLDKIQHGDASTPDTAKTTQIILTSGLVND